MSTDLEAGSHVEGFEHETAYLWSDETGFDLPDHYQTIRHADIDNDGADEMLARNAFAVEVAKWDEMHGCWQQMPRWGPLWSNAAGWDQPRYYATIQCADIDGDGAAEILARSAAGIEVWKYDKKNLRWYHLPDGPRWGDAAGWDHAQYYATIQCADIDGDGAAEILARGAAGIEAWKYDTSSRTWIEFPDGPRWSDAAGWDQPQYYTTIQCADIDGAGGRELLARSAAGIEVWKYAPAHARWVALSGGPAWSDAANWHQPQFYATIQCARLRKGAQAYLLARSASGMTIWQPVPVVPQRWATVIGRANADVIYRASLLNEPRQTLKEAGISFVDDADAELGETIVSFMLNETLPGAAVTPAGYPESSPRWIGPEPGDNDWWRATQKGSGMEVYLSWKAVAAVGTGTAAVSAISALLASAFDVSETQGSTSAWAWVGSFAKIATVVSTSLTCVVATLDLARKISGNSRGLTFTIPWAFLAAFYEPDLTGRPELEPPVRRLHELASSLGVDVREEV